MAMIAGLAVGLPADQAVADPEEESTDGGGNPDQTCPPGPIDTTQQTFILGPQQPVTTLTSDRDERDGRGEVEYQVVGRYDEGPLPDTLWLGWVPCENADPTADPIAFADEDGDGTADITGEPDVLLSTVNGEPYENVEQVWPIEVQVQEGELTFTLDSYDPACVVPVVFADQNGNGEFDLADDGTPAEPFGVAEVTWETAG